MRCGWFVCAVLLTHAGSVSGFAANYFVATNGVDSNPGSVALPWRTIQKACNTLSAGNTAYVQPGEYNEKVTLGVSGSSADGYISLIANGAAIISGAGKAGQNIIYIANKSYIRIVGFEIRDDTGVTDGSGIRIEGSGSHMELRNNRIHNIRGSNAMGITVYATSGTTPISDLIITGNEIYDCDPAQSEALTLNGNVTNFEISSNYVHDVNNIAIDMIGGEGMAPANDTARNGVCRGNRVYRSRSSYGGGYGAGIYVDGGHDIVVEGNLVSESDLGLEIGCENAGRVASNIVVRDNILYNNDKAGLVFGGYASNVGRVNNCRFLNNTLYKNDTLGDGNGELWMQFASNNVVCGNLFVTTSQNLMLTSASGSRSNRLDYNLWFATAGSNNVTYVWRGTTYSSFSAYKTGAAQDANSLFADPQLTNFLLRVTSPAIDAGDPGFVPAAGETDIQGDVRVFAGRVDIGADEHTAMDDWRLSKFTSAEILRPDIAGNFADPDGDGLVNLLEYAFNLEPKTISALGPPAIENGFLTLSYTRRQPPTDLTYSVGASDDLSNWNYEASATVELQAVDDGNGVTETVKTRDTIPVSTASRRFMRLKISQDSAETSTVGQQIGIPAYFVPGTLWTQLEAAAPTVGLVIINPDSGPGSSYDSTYYNQTKSSQSKGIIVLGYVDTAYGARSASLVESEIDTYYSWYAPDGIFLDQVSASLSDLPYYQTLYNYIKSKTGQRQVVLNPGNPVPEGYMTAGDILMTCENTYAGYLNWVASGWEYNYPAKRFWHLIHSADSADIPNAIQLSKSRHAGWVYVTTDIMPNPWDTLPSTADWATELSAVGGSVLTEISNPASNIVVNGSLSDWATLQSFGLDPNDVTGTNNLLDWLEVWMAHDATNLYLAYQNVSDITLNWAFNTYLDTDANRSTGFRGGTDNFPVGADYLLQGATIYHYTGSGTDWSWTQVATTTYSVSGRNAEFSFPRSLIGNPALIKLFFYGDNTAYPSGAGQDTCPDNALQVGGGGGRFVYRAN